MKRYLLFVLLISYNTSFGQSKSDLFIKVDSLIRDSLKFDMKLLDTSKANPRYPKLPLVILNGNVVPLNSLNKGSLKDVISISSISSPVATALFGINAWHGVILITGRKKLYRKVRAYKE